MLPDFETCRNHINAYKKTFWAPKPEIITFQKFWNYKTDLENAGQNILSEQHIRNTSAMLSSLLIYLKTPFSGAADVDRLETILENIRPDYNAIGHISLGSGRIHSYRSSLEAIYQKLGANFDQRASNDTRSSIVGKSAVLMAVWGQVPRFDSLNRIRFEKWTHTPAPEKLPYLNIKEMWYRPSEFSAIIEELDSWVLAWPRANEGKQFGTSFWDLCPGIPPGRQIDIIYHWKLPDPWVDYQLQSRGS